MLVFARAGRKQTRVSSFSATFLRTHLSFLCRSARAVFLQSKPRSLPPTVYLLFPRREINQLESSDLGRGVLFPLPDGGGDDDGDDDSELFREGLKRSAGCMNGNAAETVESRDQ